MSASLFCRALYAAVSLKSCTNHIAQVRGYKIVPRGFGTHGGDSMAETAAPVPLRTGQRTLIPLIATDLEKKCYLYFFVCSTLSRYSELRKDV